MNTIAHLRFILIICGAIVFSAGTLSETGAAPSPAAKRQPNVVFILSDNQSYYEMSCHGHAQIKTPHIDRFAKQSVEFTRFYAPPFCSPSRSVLLTGHYAIRSGPRVQFATGLAARMDGKARHVEKVLSVVTQM